MKVIEFQGEDQRLYYLVAHLVMNEDVLAYNLNYPYRTSADYRWFVATGDSSETLGFVPVKLKEGKAVLNNYYSADDDPAVLSLLLKEVVRSLSFEYEIEAVTQVRHVPVFEESGFSILFPWKRYVKMKAFNHEKECL
ncbi:MAG TPA: hypothetical protein PKC55_14845 [Dysgonomonas sp.]|uniref:hypothetical protein n=1 Tax=unclassified Dysgonomonas TaxID=2630389 RepID=UPI0025BD7F59|nr:MULTISPECIES: hypothetical protein [unclassified Dysgonomonas]HML66107.1 hypothetical protein [Dysgonomonas sp.]